MCSFLTSLPMSWAYSMSNSCRVSMWSLTKAMGTSIRFFCPVIGQTVVTWPDTELWLVVTSLAQNLDGVLGARLQPRQRTNLALPHWEKYLENNKKYYYSHQCPLTQSVGIGPAQLLHDQLHRGADLGRVGVTWDKSMKKISIDRQFEE